MYINDYTLLYILYIYIHTMAVRVDVSWRGDSVLANAVRHALRAAGPMIYVRSPVGAGWRLWRIAKFAVNLERPGVQQAAISWSEQGRKHTCLHIYDASIEWHTLSQLDSKGTDSKGAAVLGRACLVYPLFVHNYLTSCMYFKYLWMINNLYSGVFYIK